MSIDPRPSATVSSLSDKAAANSPPPAPDAVLAVALESLRVEHAHADAPPT